MMIILNNYWGILCRGGFLALAVIALSLTVGTGSLNAQPQGGEVESNGNQALPKEPFDTDGLGSKLSRVLTNYYRKTFTSQENWLELESVMFVGVLKNEQGEFEFAAYKKKPNLSKVVIRGPQGRGRLVFAYDGNEAWQSNSMGLDNPEIQAMGVVEAKNFIRDATIAGYLVNPQQEGKQIQLSGLVEVDDKTCYEIEVTLPNGERIRYAIDVVEHVERRQITINHLNNQEEINIFSDFRVVEGIRFPHISRMESNGEVVHRAEIKNIRINPGLTDAIFQRASEAGSTESETAGEKIFNDNQPVVPSGNQFGEAPFGETSFPDQETFKGAPIIE